MSWFEAFFAVLSWATLTPLAFQFSMGCSCGAPRCDECSTLPDQYQVVIAGVANGSCTTCTSLNATYILDSCLFPTPDATNPSACRFGYLFPSKICSYHHHIVLLLSHWGTPEKLAYGVRLAGGTSPGTTKCGGIGGSFDDLFSVQTSEEVRADCAAISGGVLAYLPAGSKCNHSASSATVTAL